MTATIRRGTATQAWQDLVRDAAAHRGRALDETCESHLVFVLLRHQRETRLLYRAHGIDWLDALHFAGTARTEALRDVGDRCLIVAGLFPELARRRHVSVDYYVDIGRAAYRTAADSGRRAYAALYEQLAVTFRELVQTLQAMRQLATGS